MEIIKKANRVIYKVSGETISIPSRMYPLESDSFQSFDADNTSEIVDERIIAIFDSINPEVGRCYKCRKPLHCVTERGISGKAVCRMVVYGRRTPCASQFCRA